VGIEEPANANKTLDQVGSRDRDQQSGDCAIAPTHKIRRPQFQGFNKVNRVRSHRGETEGFSIIGGVPVPGPFERNYSEMPCQFWSL
jgi:hypothetical protein